MQRYDAGYSNCSGKTEDDGSSKEGSSSTNHHGSFIVIVRVYEDPNDYSEGVGVHSSTYVLVSNQIKKVSTVSGEITKVTFKFSENELPVGAVFDVCVNGNKAELKCGSSGASDCVDAIHNSDDNTKTVDITPE